jgi:hypothetical protein
MSKSKIDNEKIEQAIQRSIPSGDEAIYIGNEQTFRLCVELQKFIKQDTDESLDPIIERFYEACNGLLVDEYGDPLSLEDVKDQFYDAWPKVSYPGLLQEAKERAKRHTIPRPELAHLDPQRCDLGTVLYEMQMMVGEDRDIYCSSYDAADILGIRSSRQALRVLKRFCYREKILRFVKQGNYRNREANFYHYIGHIKQFENEEFERRKREQIKRLNEADVV